MKAETCWSLWHPCVCSPAVALLHKNGPRHRRKIWANNLWLYSYFTQMSPSKNKNINYIFISLRVFFVCPAVQNPYILLVTSKIISSLFLYEDGFRILKKLSMVDMPLTKNPNQTKPSQTAFSGFELCSSIPFSITITVNLSAFL